MSRSAEIKKTSYVGIGANVLLAAFKAAVGMAAGSIAIILDAVNNVTDALSSGITILGVTLGGRKPDAKHPFGYGRIEYLCAIVISALVLFAGISSVVEAAKSIADPQPAQYSVATVVIIVTAVAAKIVLGLYVKKKGTSLDSDALVASGTEALGDAALSASTLLAVIASALWGISIEGYIGVVISAIIIKAGVELMLASLSHVIGKRAQGQIAADIKKEIMTVDGVLGAYDLVLHDYGPSSAMGTVHIEVADDTPAPMIHKLTKRVQKAVFKRFNIVLTVGIYAVNNTDPAVLEMKSLVNDAALAIPGVHQMHGFVMDGNEIGFDIVVDFDCDTAQAKEQLTKNIHSRIPDARVYITIDKNYS